MLEVEQLVVTTRYHGRYIKSVRCGFVLPRALMKSPRPASLAWNWASDSRPRKSSYRSHKPQAAADTICCGFSPSPSPSEAALGLPLSRLGGAVARLAWLAVRRASTPASLACLFSTCQYLIQNCHGRITVPISVASRCDAAGERAVDVLKQSSNLRCRPFATARCRDITLVQSRCNGSQ